MFYIYGTDKQRNHFTDSHSIPYFRYEEQQDPNCACLYNDNDDKAAMIVELMLGFFEVLEMRDGESVDSWQYSGYDEALEKYNELNDQEKGQEMNHKEQIKLEPDFSKMRRNVRMSLSNGVGEDFRCFDIETCMNWGEIMLLVSVLVGKDEQQ